MYISTVRHKNKELAVLPKCNIGTPLTVRNAKLLSVCFLALDACIINIMFFTQASHDHGSGTAYDRHYRCIGAAE